MSLALLCSSMAHSDVLDPCKDDASRVVGNSQVSGFRPKRPGLGGLCSVQPQSRHLVSVQLDSLICCCSVAQSCPTLCSSMDLQHARFPCPSPSPRVCSNAYPSVMPSNHLILSSASPPTFRLSPHQGLFQGVGSSHQVAKVLELQFQHQFFQ